MADQAWTVKELTEALKKFPSSCPKWTGRRLPLR